jgi:hypothetical protein
MISNLILFASFLITAFVLGQVATVVQAGARRQQPVRIKADNRRR